MDESNELINLLGVDSPSIIHSAMAHEFDAPKREFKIEKLGGPNSVLSIKHYDTSVEPLPTDDNESTNMSFQAFVNPSEKRIRIMNLKYDGRQDQINSSRSGSSILNSITRLGKKLNQDVYVDEDVSEVTLNNPYKTKANLAKLKILERGQSFYNKAGFYPEDYESIYDHNQTQRAKALGKFLRKDRQLDDFNEALGSSFTKETPLSTVGEYIRDNVGPGKEISNEFAGELVSLLDKVNFKVKDRNLKYKKE